MERVLQGRDAVQQDAAAHHEHGQGPHDRQPLHEPGHGVEHRVAHASLEAGIRAVTLGALQPHGEVVRLDDGGHQAVDADGHGQADHGQGQGLGHERRRRHGAQGHGDDFRRQDRVCADGPPDLLVLHLHERFRAGLDRLDQLLVMHLVFMVLLMGDLVDGLVAQEGAAEHQQGGDGLGRKGEGQGDQDRLVQQRAQGDLADDRELSRGVDAHDDVGVDRQIVADDPRGLLRGELRHRRHVIEDQGDVVKEGQESAYGHG